jgi:lipopolysaccharide transport system permease protein
MRITVDAKHWKVLPDLRELFAHRDLFLTLAIRDLKVRYAQTVLGLAWAVVQPLATLIIMSLIFGRAVKVETGGVPYPLFAIVGISAWSYFAFVLKESGGSIIGAQDIVRKIYFPRLIIPLSKAAVGLMDLLVALLMMAALFVWYGVTPSAHLIFAPLYLLLIIVVALGIGIWISALTIRFRDLQHVVPFMIQFGLFITPIAYPASAITASLPHWVQVLYFLNPMAGVVEGWRWSMLGLGDPGGLCLLSLISGAFLFITSFIYFRSMERVVADLV